MTIPTQFNDTKKTDPLRQNRTVAQLNRAYLHAVINAWNTRDFDVITALGLNIALAKKLANAPYCAVEFLGGFRNPVANFTGDGLMIERLLEHNISELEQQEKIDELIKLGATLEFLGALTGYHHTTLSSRARSLGVQPVGSRPTLLSPEEWDRAQSTWIESRELPALDRWIFVARKSGVCVRRLYAAFRKYDYLEDGM